MPVSLEDQLAESLLAPEAPQGPSTVVHVEHRADSRPGVFTSLSDAVDGPGEVLDNGVAFEHHTLQVRGADGASSGVVVLEGSLDGEGWYEISRVVIDADTNLYFAGTPPESEKTPVAFRFVRARLAEPVQGGTVTAYVASAE